MAHVNIIKEIKVGGKGLTITLNKRDNPKYPAFCRLVREHKSGKVVMAQQIWPEEWPLLTSKMAGIQKDLDADAKKTEAAIAKAKDNGGQKKTAAKKTTAKKTTAAAKKTPAKKAAAPAKQKVITRKAADRKKPRSTSDRIEDLL